MLKVWRNLFKRKCYYVNEMFEKYESDRIEFKEGFNLKSSLKDIIAFANTNGGTVYYGIKDNRIIKGISVDFDKSQLEIFNFINNNLNKLIKYKVAFHKVSYDKHILSLKIIKQKITILDNEGNIYERFGSCSKKTKINVMKTNSQLINENNILKKQINEMKKQIENSFKFCADCNLEKPIDQFKCTRKNPKIRGCKLY